MGMISLKIGDESRSVEATGNGPVDALYGAIDQALEAVLGWKPILAEYEIKAVSGGEDAQGQVVVRVRRSTEDGPDAFVATGHGLSTNIIEASVAAYLSGAEKLHQDGVAKAALIEARPSRRAHSPRRSRSYRDRTRERHRPGRQMTTYNLVFVPGDGIGPEVIAAGRRVLEAAGRIFGFGFDWREVLIGGVAIDAYGIPMRDQDLAACADADAVYFGAIGDPKYDDPKAKVRPEQALLALRKGLGLYANLRPVSVQPVLRASSPVRESLLEGVDMMIVRELTGGLYFGKPSEQRQGPAGREVVDTLSTRRARSGASSSSPSSWLAAAARS